MEKSYTKYSLRNLQDHLDKWKNRKDKRAPEDVLLAMDLFFCFHATKQTNIKMLLLDGVIKVKKNLLGAEYTNNATDYMQGFHNHLSMSIGRPWLEYGKYVFIYHIDKIDKNAMFFYEDPWKFNGPEMTSRMMFKEDFLTFQKFLIIKNLMRIPLTKNHYMPNIFFMGPFTSLKWNCKHTEIKQPKDLNIQDSDEIQIYSELDYYLVLIAKILLHPMFLALWLGLFLIKSYQWIKWVGF